MTFILKAKDIRFSYGTNEVLQGACISLREGSVTGIIGPNGSGKTTLMNVMSGSITPIGGNVELGEQDIQKIPSRLRAQSIATVPQESHIPFPFSALQVVLMGRAPYLSAFGFESRSDIEKAMRAMEATDCAHLASRNITQLSGGERRRVIVARALAQEPRVLLMDEPTSFLDIRHSIELARIIRDLAHNHGLAVAAVMHDIPLAASFCDEIAVLKEGRVFRDGPPRDVISSSVIQEAFGVTVAIGVDAGSGAFYSTPVGLKDW